MLAAARGTPGGLIAGPATVALEDATVRIEAGWLGRVHATGAIIVERNGPPVRRSAGPPC
jgi:N-methylhydantoinase A/oxoprolinase/acetone carboxylase beta subunit